MKRDYPDRPIVGVGAVVVENGRVLLVRRATEPLKGQWSVPGGVLEIGETLREGTAREAREETGLVIEAGEVLDVFDGIYRDPDGRTRYHYVLIDFLCRIVSGTLVAGGDAADARWFSASEVQVISEQELTAATRKLVLGGLKKAAQN